MNRRMDDFDSAELALVRELTARGAGPAASSCPSPARLQALLADALPLEQREAVESHVTGCPACLSLLQDLRNWQPPVPADGELKRLRRRIQRGQPKPEPTWHRWTWLMAPAGALAALLITLDVPRFIGPAAPLPHAKTPPIASPVYDLSSIFPLEKAPVRLPPAALLLFRGQAELSAPLREVAAALVPYQKNDYPSAARELGPVAGRHPESFEASFYLGVSLLLSGRPAEAIAPLERARAAGGAAQKPEAAWYLAVAHARSGSIRLARPLLEELCAAGHARAGSACEALGRLALPAFLPPSR